MLSDDTEHTLFEAQAILGALSGAAFGPRGIPDRWLAGIVEWPRTTSLLSRVAERLSRQTDSELPLGRVR